MSGRSAGRRAGSPDTRAEVLAAAREVFAVNGFDRATMRAIAAEAGVDPSLIYHYFGTKEDLFAASIDLPAGLLEGVRLMFGSDSAMVGRRLSETFFMVWEQEEARISLLGILRSATGGDDRAVTAFRQFLTAAILDQIAPLIPGEDARLKAMLMASHLVGVAVTRYVVKIEPVASVPVDQLVDLIAPRIQSYVES